MIDQQNNVEQLWYTWSDVGVDYIKAGFRIRAASEGLQDYRNARVQYLDRYQRYTLPQGVNPAVPSDLTPTCLALITTEDRKRILVHKKYTGRDKVGRFGAFFIHLLDNLPEEFTARDAILLWNSKFWKTSDENWPGTSLDRLSPDNLRKQQNERRKLEPHDRKLIEAYLPFLIEAFLTRKSSEQLYIAAPDKDVALLIFGLVDCLPENLDLVKNLTFSTYEADVTETQTDIVGTCWLSVKEAEKDPQMYRLLPEKYYNGKLAINCYLDADKNHLSLEDRPQLVEYTPVAKEFALFLTDAFLKGGRRSGPEMFRTLLDWARLESELNVDKLLSLYLSVLKFYESLKKKGQKPSKSDIQRALRPKSLSECEASARLLSTNEYQDELLDLVMHERGWWETSNRDAILSLCLQSREVSSLVSPLSEISDRALTIVKNTRIGGNSFSDAVAREAGSENVIDLMFCAIPPFPPYPSFDLRLSIPNKLLNIMDASTFYDLERRHDPAFTRNLLENLAQDKNWWKKAHTLFYRLVKGKYPAILPLLVILLDSPMGMDQKQAETLLDDTNLSPGDLANFFLFHGKRYIPQYPRIFIPHIQRFMNNLSIFNIEGIFRTGHSPEEPSPTEIFLESLHYYPLPPALLESIHDWYLVGKFIRIPVLQGNWQEVVTSMGRLLKQNMPLATRNFLLCTLRDACLEDKNGLKSLLTVHHFLPQKDMLQMVNTIPDRARDGIRQRYYPKTLYESCVYFVFDFSYLYQKYDERILFVQRFFDRLLWDVDRKTFNWINKRVKKQLKAFSTEWQNYVSRRPSPPVGFERIWLLRERRKAFARMRKALKDGSNEKIVRVGREYLTTLRYYHDDELNEWWNRFDNVLDDLNATNAAKRLQNKASLASEKTIPHQSARKTPLIIRIVNCIGQWRERRVVFAQVGFALSSKRIGKIVRVVTDHEIALKANQRKVPAEWQWQIDVAIEFFDAYDDATGIFHPVKEIKLVEASHKIDDLASHGYPAPRFTAHEKRRIKAARRYINNQENSK